MSFITKDAILCPVCGGPAVVTLQNQGDDHVRCEACGYSSSLTMKVMDRDEEVYFDADGRIVFEQ